MFSKALVQSLLRQWSVRAARARTFLLSQFTTYVLQSTDNGPSIRAARARMFCHSASSQPMFSKALAIVHPSGSSEDVFTVSVHNQCSGFWSVRAARSMTRWTGSQAMFSLSFFVLRSILSLTMTYIDLPSNWCLSRLVVCAVTKDELWNFLTLWWVGVRGKISALVVSDIFFITVWSE